MSQPMMPPEPPCEFCARHRAVRRGLCWRCYKTFRDGLIDGKQFPTSLYGRVGRVLAAIELLTSDEATRVRDALAMKATG